MLEITSEELHSEIKKGIEVMAAYMFIQENRSLFLELLEEDSTSDEFLLANKSTNFDCSKSATNIKEQLEARGKIMNS